MRTCLSCRAALREFRAAPERVAGVLPPAALAAADQSGSLRSTLESLLGAAQHKSAAVGERLHAATELAAGQKLAAVAASAAALAGGGTALDEYANHQGPPRPAPAEEVRSEPVKDEIPVEPAPAPPPPSEPAPVTEPPPAAPVAPPEEPPPPAARSRGGVQSQRKRQRCRSTTAGRRRVRAGRRGIPPGRGRVRAVRRRLAQAASPPSWPCTAGGCSRFARSRSGTSSPG
jgi:hypothetical protein